MRHFHGHLSDLDKPKRADNRRRLRRFVRRMKEAAVVVTAAGAITLLIGGCYRDPVCQAGGRELYGDSCRPTRAGCENETAYHYGVNDLCFSERLTRRCEYLLDTATNDHDRNQARELCGL